MRLSAFCERLDEELRTAAYADLDASANGLQVGPDSGEVESVAFCTDGVRQTIDMATDWGADAMVVHHGVSWGGIERVTGRAYNRVAPLVRNDVALYVSHLPLDGHQELGNAAGVADVLGLESREPFGAVGPEYAGTRGRLPESTSADALVDALEPSLSTGGEPVQVLDHGPDRLRDVAVVTGDGSDYVDEAAAADVDALVTGEVKQKTYHEAREADLTVVVAGHYATETFGVRNLRDWIETEWDEDLETTVFDVPTGL
ncbi:Nif3-like dinuclear metal center hexameric protein [Halorubellus sp. JP-L1]|uniref:Nif3-like dinuclear metal center hexameric protein n=1 Tax=Halorubellus sp. JP-L1 TaxID=2715753 RepID=UPI001409F8FF|nr:Nif3-like dinuclear metal center hexameric protein [Halorubellus sp. JP-L1]NHN41149.1 Nif3-like dinuclear metal center hexameric protein [Halorubellus sp. JP-L1]